MQNLDKELTGSACRWRSNRRKYFIVFFSAYYTDFATGRIVHTAVKWQIWLTWAVAGVFWFDKVFVCFISTNNWLQEQGNAEVRCWGQRRNGTTASRGARPCFSVFLIWLFRFWNTISLIGCKYKHVELNKRRQLMFKCLDVLFDFFWV